MKDGPSEDIVARMVWQGDGGGWRVKGEGRKGRGRGKEGGWGGRRHREKERIMR